jgi:hypothetical protein
MMMTNTEWAECIRYLNPLALFAVWQEDGKMWVKWDDNHQGIKPTEEECLAVLPSVQEKIASREDVVKARLAEIDLKSIRSLREWVAKQPDAPEFIKTYEAEAVTERSKLSR